MQRVGQRVEGSEQARANLLSRRQPGLRALVAALADWRGARCMGLGSRIFVVSIWVRVTMERALESPSSPAAPSSLSSSAFLSLPHSLDTSGTRTACHHYRACPRASCLLPHLNIVCTAPCPHTGVRRRAAAVLRASLSLHPVEPVRSYARRTRASRRVKVRVSLSFSHQHVLTLPAIASDS